MVSRWAYLRDIEGCEVVRMYAQNNLVEFVYLKEGRERSLTINYAVNGGVMGYCEHFDCDSIPLPPAKKLHPLSGIVTSVQEMRLYRHHDGAIVQEECEIVSSEGNYLLFFSESEDAVPYALYEKGRLARFSRLEPENATLPQELFCVEEFKEHLAFALRAHGEQKTPHGLPYSMHLLSVASEVIAALSVEPLSYDEHNVAIACALLHDVNEDTTTTITRNSPIVGHREVIAKGVMALTKDKTLASKEAQMDDSLERLKNRQACVGLVKLADRITNLGVPPKHWDERKKRAYVKEAELILGALGHTHHYLAQKLQTAIEAYNRFL